MSVFRAGSNKSSVNNFPSVRPTLDLDFANSKTLDPRITFTRASGGSYMGADGLIKLAGVNEARFDHDPYTGESLGLLVEEARTNLITYSEQFDVAGGNPASGHTITANAITAPDGTNSADLVSNVGQTVSLVEYVLTVSASSTNDYYVTIYAKKGTASYFTFNCYYNGNTEDNVDFNFDTGVVSNVPNAGEYIFQSVGNGWYRCGFRVTRDSTGTRTQLLFRFWESGRAVTSGNTYFWGAQVEAGAFPTSYIPTVASTRTRAADNASITGKNFSDFYRQDEGTFLTLTQNNTSSFGSTLHLFNGITSGNSIRLYVNFDGTMGLFVTRGSTIIQANLIFNPGLRTKYKFVGAYKLNDFAACLNGGAIASDIIGLLPETGTITTAVIGRLVSYQNAPISRLTYWPKRLPNAQLQALTK